MRGVLRNPKLQVWERWCEGCESKKYKIAGKARVHARVRKTSAYALRSVSTPIGHQTVQCKTLQRRQLPGSNDRLGFKKALPANKNRNTPDLPYQNSKTRSAKSFLCTFLPIFHSLPFLQPLYEQRVNTKGRAERGKRRAVSAFCLSA